MDEARGLSPEERGELLENSTEFSGTHEEVAHEGQTDVSTEEVRHHFIAFVNFNGQLYELDGRRSFPINRGPTSAETLLEVNC